MSQRLGTALMGVAVLCPGAMPAGECLGAGIGQLQVVSASPSPRTLHARVGDDVAIEFDRAIDPATVTTASFWAFGRWSGSATGTISLADGDRTIVLDPDDDFSAGEQVMVILSHDIAAADGSTMPPGGYSFQFWTRARPSSMTFDEADILSTNTNGTESSRPYGGIGSDMNNDGWLDLTCVNEDTADLRVFINGGDGLGTFGPFLQPPTPVNIQASPSEPSDFNRDGNVDICVANIATSSVSILLGNGDGTFSPQQEIAVGSQPRGIAVLDADGDGDIDIVNTNFSGNNLSLLLNDGTGVFGPPTFFEGGGDGERALAAGDMNGDGLLDLVASAFNDQDVLVLINSGGGGFTHLETRHSAGSMWMLVLGDVDDDGDEDVAGVTVAPASRGMIMRGTGDGGLLLPVQYTTDSFPLATDLGDLDGDGDLDWVTASYNGDWFVFENNGGGGFTFADELLAPSNASCSLPFDIDNDGDLDLALIDEIDDSIRIMINGGHAVTGDVNFDGVVNIDDLLDLLANWGSCARCAADLDGDDAVGVLDLLALLANWT